MGIFTSWSHPAFGVFPPGWGKYPILLSTSPRKIFRGSSKNLITKMGVIPYGVNQPNMIGFK